MNTSISFPNRKRRLAALAGSALAAPLAIALVSGVGVAQAGAPHTRISVIENPSRTTQQAQPSQEAQICLRPGDPWLDLGTPGSDPAHLGRYIISVSVAYRSDYTNSQWRKDLRAAARQTMKLLNSKGSVRAWQLTQGEADLLFVLDFSGPAEKLPAKAVIEYLSSKPWIIHVEPDHLVKSAAGLSEPGPEDKRRCIPIPAAS